MYRPTARQRLSKHIPAGVNARNSRTSIARQQIGKEAFSTIEYGVSALSLPSYKEDFSRGIIIESIFETPVCHDMSLGLEEFNWVEFSELAVAE
jgi:hypothetical protein